MLRTRLCPERQRFKTLPPPTLVPGGAGGSQVLAGCERDNGMPFSSVALSRRASCGLLLRMRRCLYGDRPMMAPGSTCGLLEIRSPHRGIRDIGQKLGRPQSTMPGRALCSSEPNRNYARRAPTTLARTLASRLARLYGDCECKAATSRHSDK
ncbi:hypothetical protein L227DRAFT_223855 [Lentinus tigrinus ALCF2SS1-6]|uniref:Uncharacterized protein n=1 Tax=Lentinus tigrinus ALCF2SS1-6 TaxID=1328759 RepID=A0A5C2S8Z0_9APHY|nr:hypothetical protein L227DRAFT_223855 [Lentinus tigrinus ALCF2SS1-6]